MNGCFWHGHNVETHGRASLQNSDCCKIPKSNRDFWVNKIRRNQERDQQNYRLLRENGWQVIVIWECQLKPKLLEQTMLQVELLLNENLLTRYRRSVPKPYWQEVEEPDLPVAAEP